MTPPPHPASPEMGLDVGITDDGQRWACCHPAGHVRYWFDHLAITEEVARPFVTWRRHDGDQARYLMPIPRLDPPDQAPTAPQSPP